MKLQEIDAGGFMVTVIDAISDGSPGRFSGRGFVQVPLFANKKIKCEFTNILINTDFQLADGIIRLLTDNREGGDNAIWDVDAIFEGGADNGKVRDGTDGVSVYLTDVVIHDAGTILLDTAAKEIIVANVYGELIHTDISEQLQDQPKSLTVKDSEGNLYSVDIQSGKSTSIGKAPSGDTQQQVTIPTVMSSGKGSVTFEAVKEKTKYAFDKRNPLYIKSSLFTEKYKTIKMEDGSLYDIPFKLIPAGETDVIFAKAVLKDTSLKPDSIIFQSGTGTRYLAKSNGTKGEYILTLPSGKDNDGIDIYAMYPNKGGQPYLLGKLTVMSYSVIRPKVVLVPVNGNALDETKVKAALDKVYLPVAVDWQVSTDTSKFKATADSLDVTGSGLFSQYTPGMKKLNNVFMSHIGQDYDPAALYLFVLEKCDDKNITGDMPRSKQFGYLFTGAVGHGKAADEALSRTIAHELSHGIFHLNHTFDTQYQIPKASTKNLMDYTDGTDLVKHQWDAIHDPGIVIGMFERDEEGAMKGFFGVTWLGNILWGLAPDEQEKQIEGNLSLFKHIYQHYSDYFAQSQAKDINLIIDEYKSWSVRKESHNGVAKRVFKGLSDTKTTFALSDEGIFFEEYSLENVQYKIAVYSTKRAIELNKDIRAKSFASLRYNKAIKVGYTGEYGLIVFYDVNGKMQMVLQIFGGSDAKNATLRWGNYLGLLLPSDVQKEEDKESSIQEKIKEIKLYDQQKLVEIWDGKENLVKPNEITKGAEKAVEITNEGFKEGAACNLCVRVALVNIKKDSVLYPATGSYNYLPMRQGDPVIKGKISGNGDAYRIVADLKDYRNNDLRDYFEEETRFVNETYEQFWKRLQEKADVGAVIIGTFMNDHVFMLVPGGMYKVINNSTHVNPKTGFLQNDYKISPILADGDKYGFCFANRNVNSVPRILECGTGFRLPNAPLYANMDYNLGILIKWYRYIK